MHPAVPVAALNRRLPPDAVVAADSGHHTGLVARHVMMQPGHDFAVSGLLASRASGLPYAIAAGLAFPGRPVFAVVGDGGLAMQLGEFATAVQHRLDLKMLVVRNGVLGQIKWEQMLFLGNPEFACEVPPIDFARAAEAMGGRGFTIEEPGQAGAVLDAALAAEGPSLSRRSWTRTSRCCAPRCPRPTRSTSRRRSKPARRGLRRSSGRWTGNRPAP